VALSIEIWLWIPIGPEYEKTVLSRPESYYCASEVDRLWHLANNIEKKGASEIWLWIPIGPEYVKNCATEASINLLPRLNWNWDNNKEERHLKFGYGSQ
jgi:hypothetical protein